MSCIECAYNACFHWSNEMSLNTFWTIHCLLEVLYAFMCQLIVNDGLLILRDMLFKCLQHALTSLYCDCHRNNHSNQKVRVWLANERLSSENPLNTSPLSNSFHCSLKYVKLMASPISHQNLHRTLTNLLQKPCERESFEVSTCQPSCLTLHGNDTQITCIWDVQTCHRK